MKGKIVGTGVITELGGDSPYRVIDPIHVVFIREPESDKVWASAPGLCMAVDGRGASPEEALRDLKKLISAQHEINETLNPRGLAPTMQITVESFRQHLQKVG